jgi:DNA-binding NarL/FixJ family response regulator
MDKSREKEKIKVLIADDHPVVLEGLALMLKPCDDISVIGFANNGHDAVTKARKLLPAVVILDVMMPQSNALETVKALVAIKQAPAILCCSSITEGNRIIPLINNGVRGYIMKSTSSNELQQAVRKLAAGGQYFTSEITNVIVEGIKPHNQPVEGQPTDFSQRELDIIRLICQEKASKEIAALLNMNIRTLESAKTRIMHKMEVKNIAGLVYYALKNKVVDVSDL